MNPRSTAFERSTLTRPDEPTIYCFQDKNTNHYATNEPTIYPFKNKYANHYATDEPTIYRFRDKNSNLLHHR